MGYWRANAVLRAEHLLRWRDWDIAGCFQRLRKKSDQNVSILVRRHIWAFGGCCNVPGELSDYGWAIASISVFWHFGGSFSGASDFWEVSIQIRSHLAEIYPQNDGDFWKNMHSNLCLIWEDDSRFEKKAL